MRLTLLLVFLSVTLVNAYYKQLSSGLASSRPGTQYPHTEQEYETVLKCFSKFTTFYGFDMIDNRLPSRQSAFVTQVMLNSSTICRNFQDANKCMGGRYEKLVDFDTLLNLTASSADAYYYLRQISMAEFFCGDGLPFVHYAQCMERISLSNTDAADECDEIDWDSCQNVAASLNCQASIIDTFCGASSVYSAFCEYQSIQLRMTGWNACTDIRCLSSTLSLFYTAIIVIIFSSNL
ncbi:hypothetical protein OESDEN_11401 [Oesophagostomum dentatum]|uniref:Uncharacterized protein n=1 Tax=Oesophagostomum dentatum TaxID=61180 RepID=A0A0B1SY07_OESDE|nr:hypothetical protein OESDEN_11401 [Oesophagostomum dentatum]